MEYRRPFVEQDCPTTPKRIIYELNEHYPLKDFYKPSSKICKQKIMPPHSAILTLLLKPRQLEM